jgi:hybrid cluster-associated redox disulfide protein
MEQIDPTMTIAEILKKRPDAAQILMRHGMHCLGCSVSSSESLAAAVEVHGIDLATLLKELNG